MQPSNVTKKIIRVLAISPRFAPINGADTHRLRLLLNHAAANGWQVEVLAVDARDVVGPVDLWLEETLQADVPVHMVRAWQMKGYGLNGLTQRSIWPLYRRGCALLATRRFDLVFFSTTEFALHVLGPLWQRKLGVPFCMDYQDPWVNNYYHLHPSVTPPGGRVKYAVANQLHRLAERYVVRSCAGFLSVSAAYLADLNDRYGVAVRGKPKLVRPFPAEPAELKKLGPELGSTALAVGMTGGAVWRYIGRGGADMQKAAQAFFAAWDVALRRGQVATEGARFEARGTSYASAGQGIKTFEPLVVGTALAARVAESPDRLGYSDMLRALLASDALVVFGSDDAAYTASKIYPYLLAGKPLLAIFHEESSVVRLMREVGGGACVTFNQYTTSDQLADRIGKSWFESGQFSRPVPLDRQAFMPYTARRQAQDVGQWFQEILVHARRN